MNVRIGKQGARYPTTDVMGMEPVSGLPPLSLPYRYLYRSASYQRSVEGQVMGGLYAWRAIRNTEERIRPIRLPEFPTPARYSPISPALRPRRQTFGKKIMYHPGHRPRNAYETTHRKYGQGEENVDPQPSTSTGRLLPLTWFMLHLLVTF